METKDYVFNRKLEESMNFQNPEFKERLGKLLRLQIEEHKPQRFSIFQNKFAFATLFSIMAIILTAIFYPSIAIAVQECGANASCYIKTWFTTNKYGKEVEVQQDENSAGIGVEELSYDDIMNIFDDMKGEYVEKTSNIVILKLDETDHKLYAKLDETGSWYIDPSELDFIESEELSTLMFGDVYKSVISPMPNFFRINKQILENYSIDEIMTEVGAEFENEMDGSSYYKMNVDNVDYVIEYMQESHLINMRLASGGDENGGYLKLNEKPFVEVIDRIENFINQ